MSDDDSYSDVSAPSAAPPAAGPGSPWPSASTRHRRLPQEEEDFTDDPEEDEDAAPGSDKKEKRPAIYNVDAIHDKLEDIGWTMEVDWSEHQSITAEEKTKVDNVDDDLERELAFYNQALSATQAAIAKFEQGSTSWLRPPDYYAGARRTAPCSAVQGHGRHGSSPRAGARAPRRVAARLAAARSQPHTGQLCQLPPTPLQRWSRATST
jgi:hypothetical protein